MSERRSSLAPHVTNGLPTPTPTPASPGRRRLLLGLALAPVASSPPILARALAAPAAAPVVLGFDLAAEASISASCICIFDASGRLRVVFGSFDDTP